MVLIRARALKYCMVLTITLCCNDRLISARARWMETMMFLFSLQYYTFDTQNATHTMKLFQVLHYYYYFTLQ